MYNKHTAGQFDCSVFMSDLEADLRIYEGNYRRWRRVPSLGRVNYVDKVRRWVWRNGAWLAAAGGSFFNSSMLPTAREIGNKYGDNPMFMATVVVVGQFFFWEESHTLTNSRCLILMGIWPKG